MTNKTLALLLTMMILTKQSLSQIFNGNTEKTYINVAVPKTPESESFEKYGSVPVDEFTGTPNISIPIYSLKGRFLEIPLSLNYHSSGIKVIQESTWVGLGFDLMCGGRITVETKGNVDDQVRTMTNQSGYKTSVGRLFNKWASVYTPNPNSPRLGYAFIDYGKAYNLTAPEWHTFDTIWEDNYTITESAWMGLGEPDLYHANFMGNSLTFYFDIISGDIKFLNEKSLFKINYTRDANDKLSSFTVTDNSGTEYLFGQMEKTTMTVPSEYAFLGIGTSTSAWLLTKITHSSGEEIAFTYSNSGKIYPAFSWNASITARLEFPNPNPSSVAINQIEEEPYYLSRIESGNTRVDFITSGRDDLRGPGAKKLDRIEVTDKITGKLVKQTQFGYDYFTTALDPYENSLSETVKYYYGKRLRLLSVNLDDNLFSNPYLFYYNSLAGPSKLSFSQDHWGFYNAANNKSGISVPATSPLNLIPTFGNLGSLSTRTVGPTSGYPQSSGSYNIITPNGSPTIPGSFDGYAANRNCSESAIVAFMLDSMVYPTRGSTKFLFEAHHSNYYKKIIPDFTGGGLRIKSIKSYSSNGKLENITEYDYQSSGVFLGDIQYTKISTQWPNGNSITMSTSGDLNGGSQNVGYSSVKKVIRDFNNTAKSGYTIKYYKVGSPKDPEYITQTVPFSNPSQQVTAAYLLKKWSSIAPTPDYDYDGKIYKEEAYDTLNNLVKRTDYYYRKINFENGFYSLRVADNYQGHRGDIVFNYMLPSTGGGVYELPDLGAGYYQGTMIPWRRWEVCLTPGISFTAILDSVVDKSYSNGNYKTEKKVYKYDRYNLPEYESTYLPDGSQEIVRTTRPYTYQQPYYNYFYFPGGSSGDAGEIYSMWNYHIYELPIEQTFIRRGISGDSLVVGGRYNLYNRTTLNKVYRLNTEKPLNLGSQFTPSYFDYSLSPYKIKLDTKYTLYDSATLDQKSLIRNYTTTEGNTSVIWDTAYNTMLAQCINAKSDSIAYTSFETIATGNWSYTGSPIADPNVPTGKKMYRLTGSNNITKTGLNSSSTYVVSYWTKNTTGYSIAGTVVNYPVGGSTVNGWKYFEHKVTGQTQVNISGTGLIDELRLYPEKSLMTTYTYEPLIGVSNQCDANNRISYYKYDGAGRLALVLDQNKKIVQKICYNYYGQTENCNSYTNTYQEGSFVRNTGSCPSGTVGGIATYSVPASTYYSAVSVADANEMAMDEMTANGQAYADSAASCVPSYYYTSCCGFGSAYSSFGSPSTGVANFSLVVYKQSGTVVTGTTYQIGTLSGMYLPSHPSGTTIIEGGRNWTFSILQSGYISIRLNSGTPPANQIQINGTYNL